MNLDHDDLKRAWAASASEEPPAALDDVLRAAARRAVHARPRAHGFAHTWFKPLAAAAVVVLGVSTVLTTFKKPHSEQPVFTPSPSSSVSADAVLSDTPASAGPAVSAESELKLNNSEAQLGAVAKPSVARQTTASNAAALPAPAPPQPSEALILQPERERSSEREEVLTKARSDKDQAPARAAPAVSGGFAPDPEAAFAELDSANDASKKELSQRSQTSDARLEARRALATPEAWLEHLRELHQRGDERAFESALTAFRQAHPGYPLPPAWLSKPR